MYYYGISIVLIILVIIIVVTIWKRKQKRSMLFIEQIQLHDYDKQPPPEYMNNDTKGKLGDDPFLKVSQDPIYESLEQLPHNENSYEGSDGYYMNVPMNVYEIVGDFEEIPNENGRMKVGTMQ